MTDEDHDGNDQDEGASTEQTVQELVAELLAAKRRFELAVAEIDSKPAGAINAVNPASREALGLNRLVRRICHPDLEEDEPVVGLPFSGTAMKVLRAADRANPRAQLAELAQRFARGDMLRADDHVRLARVSAEIALGHLKDVIIAHDLDLALLGDAAPVIEAPAPKVITVVEPEQELSPEAPAEEAEAKPAKLAKVIEMGGEPAPVQPMTEAKPAKSSKVIALGGEPPAEAYEPNATVDSALAYDAESGANVAYEEAATGIAASTYEGEAEESAQAYDGAAMAHAEPAYEAEDAAEAESEYDTGTAEEGQSEYDAEAAEEGESEYDTVAAEEAQPEYDTAASEEAEPEYDAEADEGEETLTAGLEATVPGAVATVEDLLATVMGAKLSFDRAAAKLDLLQAGAAEAMGAVNLATREALALNRLMLGILHPDLEEGEPVEGPAFTGSAKKVLTTADRANPKAQLAELALRFARGEVLRADEHVRLARVAADMGIGHLKDAMLAGGIDLAVLPLSCVFAEDLARLEMQTLRDFLVAHQDHLEQLHVNAQLAAVIRLCEGVLPGYDDMAMAGRLLGTALAVAPEQHQGKVHEAFVSRIGKFHRGNVVALGIAGTSLEQLRRIVPDMRATLAMGLVADFMTKEIGQAIGKVLVSLRLDTPEKPEARAAADRIRASVTGADRAFLAAGVVASMPPEAMATTTPEQAENLAAAVVSGPAEDRALLLRLLLGLASSGEVAAASFMRALLKAEAHDPGKVAAAVVRALVPADAARYSRESIEALRQIVIETGGSRFLLRQLEDVIGRM